MLFVLTPLSCEIFFQKNKFLNSIGIYFSKACNFIKIETLAQVFSWEFCKVSKNTFFTEHLWATAVVLLLILLFWLSPSLRCVTTE